MIYTGIDYHKSYSVACTLDAQGRKLHEAGIGGNAAAAFAGYFKTLGEPSEGLKRGQAIRLSVRTRRPKRGRAQWSTTNSVLVHSLRLSV